MGPNALDLSVILEWSVVQRSPRQGWDLFSAPAIPTFINDPDVSLPPLVGLYMVA
jgi:hypothetical protein